MSMGISAFNMSINSPMWKLFSLLFILKIALPRDGRMWSSKLHHSLLGRRKIIQIMFMDIWCLNIFLSNIPWYFMYCSILHGGFAQLL